MAQRTINTPGKCHASRYGWLLMLCWPLSAMALQNQLLDNPSPYLAMHATDPVAWQTWNPQTLAQARREHKLLYVSVGYFACHWCHVMQQESYRNAAIATVLNRDFIPVKVDRELETSLDADLQAFSERTQRQAGWPLNAFVTPDGYPLLTVLYLPPNDFLGVLNRLALRWQQDAASLSRLAQQAAQTPQVAPDKAVVLDVALLATFDSALRKAALQNADTLQGGFGQVSKFPMTPQLNALLSLQSRQPDRNIQQFLTLTLAQMRTQGLNDLIGGGFFRYTTDPDWRTPHFEKMLYDNAQLALLYLRAADRLKQPDYRDTAYRTLDFMLDKLADPRTGGLMSSLSAVDQSGKEGAAYLWSRAQIEALLTPTEFQLASKRWRLDQVPDFELGYLPIQRVQPEASEAAAMKIIISKLAHARMQRGVPRDAKQIASLNGLALSALSQAAKLAPRYRAAAQKVHEFIWQTLWQQGSLAKAYAAGQVIGVGELEDYAFVAAGLSDYAQLTGQAEHRQQALAVQRTAWARFYSPAGWKTQQRSLLSAVRPAPALADGAMASPSARLIQLGLASTNAQLRQYARQALMLGLPTAKATVFEYTSYLDALADSLPARP